MCRLKSIPWCAGCSNCRRWGITCYPPSAWHALTGISGSWVMVDVTEGGWFLGVLFISYLWWGIRNGWSDKVSLFSLPQLLLGAYAAAQLDVQGMKWKLYAWLLSNWLQMYLRNFHVIVNVAPAQQTQPKFPLLCYTVHLLFCWHGN